MIALLLATALGARVAAAREVAAKYIALHKVPVRERNAEAMAHGGEVLIRYDQVMGGVRVYGCQFNLYVMGSNVRIGFNGLQRLPPVDTHPKISRGAAADIAMRRTTREVRRRAKPELIVVPRGSFAPNLPSTDRLVWQVGSIFIDALNGQMLYEDDATSAPSPLRH